MQFIDLPQKYRRHQAEFDARMRRVFEHDQYIMEPEIAELESALAPCVGVERAATVAGGTNSLKIALRVLGIGLDDAVITGAHHSL